MSRHDPLVTLRQIEDFARQAATPGVEGSRQELDSDWKYLLAAERAVELIGEPARERTVKLPPPVKPIPAQQIRAIVSDWAARKSISLVPKLRTWARTLSGAIPLRGGWWGVVCANSQLLLLVSAAPTPRREAQLPRQSLRYEVLNFVTRVMTI